MSEQQQSPEPQRAVTFADVCGGAMAQAFESSLKKCLANIMDPNTEARAKRKIHLTLTLAPKAPSARSRPSRATSCCA